MGSRSMTAEQARRILGVAPGCDGAALRAAFNIKVKTSHPDGGGTEQLFQLTVEAYRYLDGRPETEEHTDSGPGSFDPGEQLERLEISPSLAVVGGRVETRLRDGRRLAITLPAGKRQGDRISVGGTVLSIMIKGRPDIFVAGDDLCLTVRASEATLREGGRIKLKTPTGARMLWIPKQAGTNHIVRIPGQGLPATDKHPRQGALVLKLAPEIRVKPKTKTETKRKGFSSLWGGGKTSARS
jgi:curved DNA-binding protein